MNSQILGNIIKYTKDLNLLYVEDNHLVRFQTIKMLQSFFGDIKEATNGKEALEIFSDENLKFDLIITDIKMPFVDGISFIELVRKKNKKIPILIFSAYDDKEYFMKTINLGIDGYILKPYTITQIATTLINIIEKYELKEPENISIYLENDFIWLSKDKKLLKNNNHIKLTKTETMLFDFFISTNSVAKSYDEIEDYLYSSKEDGIKKIRNLVNRLRVKLNYELFETNYSIGYTIKYKNV